MENLALISLNVNGMRSTLKRRALFNDLRNSGSDIIFLQETHCTHAEEKIWLSEWGASGYFCHGKSNSRGVAILFSRTFNPKIESTSADDDGRLLVLQIKRGDTVITLANVYAPTQSEAREQDTFSAYVDETLANLEVQTLLIGGDFNVNLDRCANTRLAAGTESYIARIKSLLEVYMLEDIWKLKNPLSTRGTFHRGAYSARLDYWFIPAPLLPQASIKITPHPLSDHCLISLKISIAEIKRGPGYWRFNNALLADTVFVTEMSEHIREFQQEKLANPNLQWEWSKYKIRAFCIQYSINKNRRLNQHVRDMEKRLDFLAKEHDLTSSPDVVEEATSIKRELGEISQSKASAAAFRARTRWTLHGEKPTAYFLGLEKRAAKNNTVSTLIDAEGYTVTDNKTILEMERDYFENIYTEKPEDLDPVDLLSLSQDDAPVISDLHKQRINRPFTIQEFHEALKDLNKNKSPGTDGITPEFFLAFWDLLKDEFMQSMEYSLENGSLTDQQATGVITLIPKKEQDRQQLSNWRPITLLNSDAKILSKALAKRIQSCIQEVVSEDQTGFIRGRRITSNLLNTQSIIDFADETSTPGIMLALDYSKAFDTVRWKLISKALHLFGFGDFIISVVNTLFKNIRTCVSNAGFSSDPFYPTRGIRQGCCASPVLFVLAVELLAIIVRKTEEIQGITIAGKTTKISQYADDATFFLANSTSLDHLILSLNSFSRLSGLKMNSQKSHLLLLGNYKDPPTSIHGIQVSETVKILGMTYKTKITEEEQYALNFASRIAKIKHICSNWMNRNMSLRGKVTLVNALMASVMQYPCACTFTPTRVNVEFKKIIVDFLWDKKRSKIAYNLMIQQIEDGGLKLADLDTRLDTIHLGLIRQIWNSPTSTWANILAFALQARDIKQVLLFKADLVTCQPTRYKTFMQLLKTWVKYHKYDPNTESEVQEETLWNNRDITISGSSISWPRWKEAGINSINDLLHKEEPRFSSHLEVSSEYNIQCSFLQILQLRSAIPCRWKRLLAGPRRQDLVLKPLIKAADNSTLQVSEAPAKRIYNAILPYKLPQISSQAKWDALYPSEAANSRDRWKGIYTSAFHATRESKLQAFQYRVIHRTIPCNRYLYNIKIKQDDHCPYCEPQATDTLQHFLFSCPKVSRFWNSVCRWLATQANFHITLTEQEFLFGVTKDVHQSRAINFLAITAKYFIYRQKLFHNSNLDLTHFLRELKGKLAVEKFISTQEKKPGKFRQWDRIYAALG